MSTADTTTLPARFPDRPLDQAAERWWVAKVKPRQEKQLATDFLAESIEYYLPLYARNTPRPGTKHKRIFHVPLFPGYICFAQNQPHNIYRSGRIVNLIEIKHQRRFIRELNQIYFALQGNAPIEPVNDAFPEGTLVKIIHGPLTGIQGVVSKDPASNRLILSVEGLGNASLTIERSWLVEVEPQEEHD